jgi:cell division protein FtsW
MSMALKAKLELSDRCPVDPIVAGTALILLLIGMIMVGSASTEVSARTYGSPFYLLIKHSAYVLIGLVAGIMATLTPVRIWKKLAIPFLVVSFGLLIAVLVPGVGREVNGATRWIPLGFFTIQGSEFVKLFSVFYIATYLVQHKAEVQSSITGFMKPLALVTLLVVLLLGQPDFGASVVIMVAVMGVIFLSGIPLKYFMPVVVTCVGAVALIATLQPYRLARLTTFTDPWEHQFDGGYQLTQALIAFGRGEWFGLGLGNSIQKLFFLPEAHTDFLFSIIAEELGIIGASLVIVLFACLVIRALWIGSQAIAQGEEFHAYVAYGIALLLGVQASINLGVNLGLLPTKGLTLPLMSFGGNSLVVSCVLVAILLRVEYEIRNKVAVSVPAKRGRRNG